MNTVFLRPIFQLFLWLLVLFSTASYAASAINWAPTSITQNVATGQNITVPVTFTASKNISNAVVTVVPKLAPFVATSPSSFEFISRGESVTLNLTISAAADSPITTFDGAIQLRSGGKSKAVLAKPLPLSISIEQGDASFSTPPDPDKVIIDPEGSIYPLNQLLLLLDEGYSRGDADDIASSINGRVIGVIPLGNIFQIEIPSNTIQELDYFIDLLENDLRVKSATQNFGLQPNFVTTDLENLKNYDPNLTRAYDRLNLDKAWSKISASSEPLHPVTIGIVDTGIDKNHPEFEGVIIEGASSDKGEKDCGRTIDSHGTQVAGIIGANNLSSIATLFPDSPHMNGIMSGIVRGIEDDARGSIKYELLVNPVHPSRIQEYNDREWTATQFDYINESVRRGAQIVNYSSGGGRCDIVEKECGCVDKINFESYKEQWVSVLSSTEKARKVLFVMSAGNDNIEAIYHLPGGGITLDNLITVGATTVTGVAGEWCNKDNPNIHVPVDSRACFSNYGDGVDISAPGEQVYAPGIYTTPLDRDDYKITVNGESRDYFLGTSASAPMVAGVAGLIKAIKGEEITPFDIKTILKGTGDAISVDQPIGNRLNAYRAVCDPKVDLDCVTSQRFAVGDQLEVVTVSGASVLVFDAPDGTVVGTQETGSKGEVVGGALYSTTLSAWMWQVNFDTGVDGWVAENYLQTLISPPPPTSNCANLSPNKNTFRLIGYVDERNQFPNIAPNSFFPGGVKVGDPFEVIYSIDPLTVDNNLNNPNYGEYGRFVNNANGVVTALCLSIPGGVYIFDSYSLNANSNFIKIYNDSGLNCGPNCDVYELQIIPNNDLSFGLAIEDPTGSLFSTDELPLLLNFNPRLCFHGRSNNGEYLYWCGSTTSVTNNYLP